MTTFRSRFTMRFIALIACLQLCLMNAKSESPQVLFDFSQVTQAPAWQIVNDDVMGGVSSSRFQIVNGTAVFQGEVSLENNGGFASVRTLPARHDLSGSDAFLLRVRGDGRRYKFTVRMSPRFDSAIYQMVFQTTSGEWMEHRLPFEGFVPTWRGRVLSSEPSLDPGRITSVGFLISDKQRGPFNLEIAWIKAVPPAGQ
jgi:hypothetical protein